MSQTILQLNHVDRLYEQHFALRDISMQISAGEAVWLYGENGAGKSTLMQIAATVMAPSSGTVTLFAGQPFAQARCKLGAVLSYSLAISLFSTEENFHFYRGLRRLGSDAELSFDRLGLREYWHRPVHQLSSGYRRRLDLALALMHQPALLLLDEPLAGLDDDAAAVVGDLLAEFKKNGGAMLFAGHGQNGLERLFDRQIKLHGGRLCD